MNSGGCPRYALCNDTSTDVAPSVLCVCQMGTTMVGGACVLTAPPASTPAPAVTLSPQTHTIVIATTRTAAFILIGCIIATLVLFAIFRVFNRGRFIHMNIEVALLVAFLLLVPEPPYDDEVWRLLLTR